MNTQAAPQRARPPRPRSSGTGSLYRLAWRNLWRQRRRTLLLVVVVAYATLAIIFFWSFTDGFLDSVLAGQARLVNAPALVSTAAYFDDPDPENALPALENLETLALASPWVEAVAPRLDFPALLRSAYATEGAQVRGVDPGLEPTVSNVPASITQGRMIASTGEVVLGLGLAERIDIRLGERLAVDVASVAGPQAAGLTLVGLVDSGVKLVDDSAVLIHIDQARELTGVTTATGLALDVPRGRDEAAVDALNTDLPDGVRAYGLLELLGALARGLAAERVQMIPLGLIFSLFAAITVTSSVVVSVMERTREFGVMIALGLDQNRLAWLVTLEAIFATVVGFAVGTLLGYGLTVLFGVWNGLGAGMNNLYGDLLGDFGIGDEVYTSFRLEYLLYAGITIALAALFAALTPARRVRRLNPSEAMRAE